MLFCGDARHRLEPVGEMGGALADGPQLHGLGNGIGHFQRQGRAGGNAVLPGSVDRRLQVLLHGIIAENIAAEDLRQIHDLAHRRHPF